MATTQETEELVHIEPPFNIDTVDILKEVFCLSELRKTFEWATSIRAGFVFVVCTDQVTDYGEKWTSNKMLLVHEVPMPGHKTFKYGPPKGLAEPEDVSAFDTAVRELREETGIEFDETHAVLAPGPLMFKRHTRTIGELFIYFIAVASEFPKITADKLELEGYTWMEIDERMKAIENVSHPTKSLLGVVSEMNLKSFRDLLHQE